MGLVATIRPLQPIQSNLDRSKVSTLADRPKRPTPEDRSKYIQELLHDWENAS